jgi:Na+-transporting methylmalonyl-CoA/oxaloacetate decarboxylase gamma subunit
MSVGTALVIAASGFITVFLMLALLWGAIVVVSKVLNMIAPVKAPAPAAAPAAPVAAAPAAGTFGGDVALIDVDEKTAACVMAIVSHETGIPLSELIFKKIKAL